jgi:hypothetical protein
MDRSEQTNDVGAFLGKGEFKKIKSGMRWCENCEDAALGWLGFAKPV